jgi:hypothetical protein
MLGNLFPNTSSLVDALLGTGVSTGSGTLPNAPTTANTPGLTAVLKLDEAQLLNVKASLATGESLLVVNGNVFEKHANGAMLDLGLDIGPSPTSTSSLITSGGKILAQGTSGSLIDLNLGLGADGLIGVSPVPVQPALEVDIFRFYNVQTGVHFFTASLTERDSVIQNLPQFKYEGTAFDVSTGGSANLEVYRFYNAKTGTHFYTASATERDAVKASLHDFNFEGTAYKAYTDDGNGTHTALYRLYNTETGAHFYTVNEQEVASVVQNLHQYKYEGIAYYVDPM